ncbi:MAG: ABC transporter permease [Bryobacteraceae bacterium]|nr:ABC transporter permease [Bryobacteraceae bacterium]
MSADEIKRLPWSLWWTQVLAIMRLELRKSFFSRRSWWIYLLACLPALLTTGHSLIMWSKGDWNHAIGFDSNVFGYVFLFGYVRLGIYFGCVILFSNLFRGEMLARTLHYYLLAPVRRDVLAVGKFLSSLAAAVLLFTASVVLSYVTLFMHFGRHFEEFLLRGGGLEQLGWYVAATALACLGYGSVFLLMGLLFRNPMLPAAIVMVWEGINAFLPPLLKKISIIFYLKSLCPVPVTESGGLAFLAMETDPAPAWLAIAGLLALAAATLAYAGVYARRIEISYAE